jgi:hypothetical protein
MYTKGKYATEPTTTKHHYHRPTKDHYGVHRKKLVRTLLRTPETGFAGGLGPWDECQSQTLRSTAENKEGRG